MRASYVAHVVGAYNVRTTYEFPAIATLSYGDRTYTYGVRTYTHGVRACKNLECESFPQMSKTIMKSLFEVLRLLSLEMSNRAERQVHCKFWPT